MEASAAHLEHGHGHMPVANASAKVNRELFGMGLFIFSEVMLFASFFTAYFFIRVVQGQDWMPAGQELPVGVAAANSVILLSSSATLHWALEGIRRDNRAALKTGLVLTILRERSGSVLVPLIAHVLYNGALSLGSL